MTTNAPQGIRSRGQSTVRTVVTATLVGLAIVGGILVASVVLGPGFTSAVSKGTGAMQGDLSQAEVSLANAPTLLDQSLPANESRAVQAVFSNQDTSPRAQPLAAKTQAGVTVVITWAYADVERVGIEYKVTGVAVPDGYLRLCPIREASFTEGATTVTLGQNDVRCEVDAAGDFRVSQSFDRTADDSPVSTQIALNVAVGGVATIPQPVAGAPAKAPFEIKDAGVFRFVLDIPITSGLTITEPQEVKQPTATATLKRVEINPSLTRAEICWQLPSAADWLPAAVLQRGDEVVQGDWFMKNAKDAKTLTGDFRCYVYSFPVTYGANSQTEEFTITIHELRTSVPELLDSSAISKAQEKLARGATGVDFAYKALDQGFTLEITEKPDGMTDAQAYRLIADALADTVNGPWVFTLSTP